MELSLKLLLLTLSLLVLLVSPARSALDGLRVDLSRIDSKVNFTKLELIQRAAARSKHRMSRLTATSNLAANSVNKVPVPVHAGNGEFLMDLAIGTPALPFSAIVDTGSDLIWTQCKPCTECFDQPTPIFDPSRSSSFAKLPCSGELCQALPNYSCAPDCEYLYTYGDSSSSQGVLASETFSFVSSSSSSSKPVSAPGIGFGCGDTNQGSGFSQGAGLVGLGRGPLSLVSQLGLAKFSYCLTALDESSKKSPLLFGTLAELNGSAIQSTPLVRNPSQPSFYYLTLKGITVGATRVHIPSSTFALNKDGSGGLIIDSGTSITYLEEAGYRSVKKAFVSQMKLPVADGSDVGLDLCFAVPSGSETTVEVPALVLHFDGGADWNLAAENYVVVDSSSGLLCLAMMGSRGMSILGNFQQQNMHVLYDLKKEKLSFVPAQCDQM